MNIASACSKAYRLARKHNDRMAVVSNDFGENVTFSVKSLSVAEQHYPEDIYFIVTEIAE